MTEAQQKDLFIEWDIYETYRQQAVVDEYRLLNKGDYSKSHLLDFSDGLFLLNFHAGAFLSLWISSSSRR